MGGGCLKDTEVRVTELSADEGVYSLQEFSTFTKWSIMGVVSIGKMFVNFKDHCT